MNCWSCAGHSVSIRSTLKTNDALLSQGEPAQNQLLLLHMFLEVSRGYWMYSQVSICFILQFNASLSLTI